MELRPAGPPARDETSDPELLTAIRSEIAEVGPMTFARFMEIALYDPARGYYRGPVARPGRAGDFLTAPEASPIFGRTLARLALAVHAAIGAPDAFAIREHGAGTGALAAPLVGALLGARHGPRTIRYLVDEIEPARVAAVREAVDAELATAARDTSLRGAAAPAVGRVAVESDDGRPIVGFVVANEVLDALPTHRVVGRGGAMREVLVDVGPDGSLVDREAEPTTPALANRLAADGVALADGQRAEICLALDGWVERAAAGLGRGALLLIDYGHAAEELYDPRRCAAGTLATYLGHRVGEDPYRAVGRQDITAHVDFSAVERAAAAAGLVPLGVTTQAELLDRLGAGELLVAEQTAAGADLQSYLATRSALVRMIDPAAMGRFRVLAFGRGLAPDTVLPGFG